MIDTHNVKKDVTISYYIIDAHYIRKDATISNYIIGITTCIS
jgi:hypothetical protein